MRSHGLFRQDRSEHWLFQTNPELTERLLETLGPVEKLWRKPSSWWKASMLKTARVGWFSSDRTIREYAQDIWKVPTGPQ